MILNKYKIKIIKLKLLKKMKIIKFKIINKINKFKKI